MTKEETLIKLKAIADKLSELRHKQTTRQFEYRAKLATLSGEEYNALMDEASSDFIKLKRAIEFGETEFAKYQKQFKRLSIIKK